MGRGETVDNSIKQVCETHRQRVGLRLGTVCEVREQVAEPRKFARNCSDHHQAEAILSAGTFQPGDLIGASVGRALWSDGGPAKPVQFYEVPDDQVQNLDCGGYGPI